MGIWNTIKQILHGSNKLTSLISKTAHAKSSIRKGIKKIDQLVSVLDRKVQEWFYCHKETWKSAKSEI